MVAPERSGQSLILSRHESGFAGRPAQESGKSGRASNAKENAWFIALGHLPAGRYRATLGMNGQIAFFFVVDRSSVHYLRLKSSNCLLYTSPSPRDS